VFLLSLLKNFYTPTQHTHKHTHIIHTTAHTHLHPAHTRHTHIRTYTHIPVVTMSTASTAKPPAKRVRIDQDTPPVINYTPIAGSVSTLLPVMKELVQHYYEKFNKTSKNIYDKNNIIKKLQQPDFIPRSARSNFKIGASETLKMSNEYNTLVTDAAQVTAAFEKQQKRNIVRSAKLEKEVYENQRNTIFIEGIYKISCMIYHWKTDTDETNEAEIHHLIKELIKKDSSLLTYAFNSNYGQFATQYNIVYPLSSNIINPAGINIEATAATANVPPAAVIREGLDRYFPRTTVPHNNNDTNNNINSNNNTNNNVTVNNNNNHQILHTQDTATVTTLATTASTQDDMLEDDDEFEIIPSHHLLHETEVQRLLRILKDAFVTSWSNEQRRMENKTIELKMAKYVKTQLTTKATDEAAAIVANEPAAEMKLLHEIIDKKVNEHTKKLQKELQTTKQQLQRLQTANKNNQGSKNSSRGETNTRASTNKSIRNQRRPRSTSTNRSTSSNSTQQSKNRTGKNKNTSANTTNGKRTTNNSGTARKPRNNPRRKSTSNDPNPTTRQDTNNNRNQTPRRRHPRNQHNQRNGKADDAQQDSQRNKGRTQSNNNKGRATSRNRNSSTGRGRSKTRQR
jgi:hypothetical protein